MLDDRPAAPSRLLTSIRAVSVAAYAAVPGAYAWAVTVAPVAWARSGSALAKAAALVGLSALVVGAALHARWGVVARLVSFWMFVLTAALVWSASPAGVASLRADAVRGFTGVLGWMCSAFAFAAPPLERQGAPAQPGDRGETLAPRQALPRAHGAYLAVAAALALAAQAVGWRALAAERAVLVRFVGLAVGLAVIGASIDIALARSSPRSFSAARVRLRRAMAALLVLGMLALAGLLFVLQD